MQPYIRSLTEVLFPQGNSLDGSCDNAVSAVQAQQILANQESSSSTSDKKELPPTEKTNKPSRESPKNETEEPRKPGKQPGAKRSGLQQTIAITDYKEHFPEICECCHQPLNDHFKKSIHGF